MATAQNSSLALRAKLFRGLADSSRLAILESLRSGDKTVSEIVSLTGLSQPNVSGHLICLKECGLVASRQEGRCVVYGIADQRMVSLMETAERILSGVAERVGCCSNYECNAEQRCAGGRTCVSPVRLSPHAVKPASFTLPVADHRPVRPAKR